MKKTIIVLFITLIPFYLFGWAECVNTGGGTPEQPSTIYLGDTGTFGCDAWANDGGNWGRHQVVIHTSSDIDNGTFGDWSEFDNVEHNQGTSPRFTSTGTWYWGLQLNYSIDYGYYCRNDASWYSMWASPTSNLTVTVNALNNPSDLSITNNATNPNTALDLSWNKDAQSHNVLIVRRAGQAVEWSPTQGVDYTDGQSLGNDTYVVKGSELETSIIDDNGGDGLDPNTTYYYKIYSENFQYYSSGVTGDQQTLPVELSTFTAQYLAGKPLLYWTTQSETDNMGWFVYRNQVEDFTSATKVSGMIEGHGTTTQAQSYIYEDVIADPQVGDVYYYWLESVDYSGTIHHFDKVAMITIPETNDPNQNVTPPQVYDLISSPNPFNESTKISFTLTQSAMVDVAIYDVKGALVKSFNSLHITADDLVSLQWDGKDENGKSLSNGIYLYSVKVNGQDYATKQVILMK